MFIVFVWQNQFHQKSPLNEPVGRMCSQIHNDDFVCCLGKGAFGNVDCVTKRTCEECKDHFEHQGRQFARKCVMDLDEAVEEERIHLGLDHPNIVKLWFREGTMLYMDVCDGNLEGVKLEPKDAFTRMIDVLQGLEYIHSKNIVHMDIKPQNLLVRNQTVLLGDFGCSKQLDEIGFCWVYRTTPGIVPHELEWPHHVYVSGKPVDIWMAGMVFVYLVTGKMPWKSAHYHQDSYRDWYFRERKSEIVSLLDSIDCLEIAEAFLKVKVNDRPTATEMLKLMELWRKWK